MLPVGSRGGKAPGNGPGKEASLIQKAIYKLSEQWIRLFKVLSDISSNTAYLLYTLLLMQKHSYGAVKRMGSCFGGNESFMFGGYLWHLGGLAPLPLCPRPCEVGRTAVLVSACSHASPGGRTSLSLLV